ncbi:MAG TPA: flagellar hook-associated protein FlgK [Ilumatobacteraceae bacterium]
MTSSALSIAVSALRAQQYAIETTSQNVANAATPGYRRQTVNLVTAYPRQSAIGPMGAGVQASGVLRATDALADMRVRTSSAQASYFGTKSSAMSQVEDTFGEPDQGITTQLSSVWSAFSALAVSPSDDAARYGVLSSLQGLADRVNSVRSGLDQLSANAQTQLSSEVSSANDIAARLAKINTLSRVPGGLPPDLADERDRDIDSLASSLGAVATTDADGDTRVTVSGMAIVDGDHSTALTVSTSPPGTVTHPSGPITLSGTVGGLQSSIQTDIPDARYQLDTFVSGLTTAMNSAHASGFTPSGAAGGPLLAEVSGKLTVMVTQPGDLAATDTAGQTQNGTVADTISQLSTTQGDAFRAVVASITGKVAGAARSADTAQSVADSASSARDSSLGVNVDEEMTNLITQQRAYDSAAKIVSVVDQMLQTLIQM